MSVLTPTLRAFLDEQIVGVLASQPTNGHARQSVVHYVRDGELLLISSVAAQLQGSSKWSQPGSNR